MPVPQLKINVSNEVETTGCEWNFWLIRMGDLTHLFPTQGRLHKVIGKCWCKPTRHQTGILYRNIAGDVLHRFWVLHKHGEIE